MRKQKSPVNFSGNNGLRADDTRRRVAECRERLRRKRAASRIADCATTLLATVIAEEAERAFAPAVCEVVGERP